MTKQEYIQTIEKKELARLNALTYDEIAKEVSEWFNDSIEPTESREEIINDYLADFMRYKQDNSMEELQEILKHY